MADLERFSVDDLVELSARLRELGVGAPSMAAVASEIVETLHTSLRAADGSPACASVRLLKTHRFGDLPATARRLTAERAGTEPPGGATSLATLAWAGSGDVPADWLVLPFDDEASVAASPFLREALIALDVSTEEFLRPVAAQENELHRRPHGIFHVPDATVPYAPVSAEGVRCVARTGIRSIVAIGGGLLSGDIFLLVICSKVPIDGRVAKLLKTLTPAIKTALVPMTFTVFGARA